MTQEKTEELKELEKSIFSPDEISEMFDSGFLAKLQLFAVRMKKDIYADKDINCYMARMNLKFEDIEGALKYESIKDAVGLQLQPVFQEDLDKEKERSAAEAKCNEVIEGAQATYKAEIKRLNGDGEGEGEPA